MTHYWDGMNMIYETCISWRGESDPSYDKTYIYGINLIKSYIYNKYTDVVTEYYYYYNAHGDVIGLTGTNGNIAKTYHYSAFGIERNPSATDMNPCLNCASN